MKQIVRPCSKDMINDTIQVFSSHSMSESCKIGFYLQIGI